MTNIEYWLKGANTVEVIFNGEKEALDQAYSVTEFIRKFELNPDVVSVSLNGNILRREEFDTTALQNGDTIDVLMFMGGGR